MAQPKVNEFSSDLEEINKSVDVSVTNIAKCIKIAMGEFTGIAELFNNIDGTISLVCKNSGTANNFSKLQISKDCKSLLGVMFIGKTVRTTKKCFLVNYGRNLTKLHFRLFSIVANDPEQINIIHKNFNERFNTISNQLHDDFENYDKKVKVNRLNTFKCCMTARDRSISIPLASMPINNLNDELNDNMDIKTAYEIFDKPYKKSSTTFIPDIINCEKDHIIDQNNIIKKGKCKKEKQLLNQMIEKGKINSYNMKLY